MPISSHARAISFTLAYLFTSMQMAYADGIDGVVNEHSASFLPLVEQLFEMAHASVKFSVVPTERARRLFLAGVANIEFFRVAATVDGVKSKVSLVGPLLCSETVAFVRRDGKVRISSIADLGHYTIGVVRGGVEAATTAQKARPDFDRVDSTEQLMKMLDAGRFDVAIATRRNGMLGVMNAGLETHLEIRGPILTNAPAYILLQGQASEYAGRLNEAAKTMIESGKWQSGVRRVNLKDGIPAEVGLSCLKHGATGS